MKSQVKEGPRGGRNARAGQTNEGPKSGRMSGKEGARKGKGNDADVKLGEGLEVGSVHSAHKKGLVSGLGGHQAASVAPTGESNHETLRHGSKPKPESVQFPAVPNTKTLKKARGFNERSIAGNAEKGGGW